MSSLIIGGIGVILIFALIGCGVHIAVSTGVIGVIGTMILIGTGPALKMVGILPFTDLASFTWVTLPMFILMGEFALTSGVSERAFIASYRWLGHIRGGLAMAVTATSALFAACSGSSLATTAMMARLALPEMRKFNYNIEFSSALIASTGSLAALIPPSMLMIVYSMLTQTSLVRLLMAGFIPGFITAGVYMAMIYLVVRVKPHYGPRAAAFPWKERWQSLPNVTEIALIMIFVIGGMYSGVFTATEAAAAGAVVTLIMALVRRRLSFGNLTSALNMAGVTTASIFFIIVGTMYFGKFLSYSGLPKAAVALVATLNVHPIIIFMFVIILYVFLGMFLEVVCMMAVSLPVVFPIMTAIGFDPIWFGVIIIKMCEVAAITPPVGLNVYTVQGVIGRDVKLEGIFRNIVPFFICDIITVAMFTAFPRIVLWLPDQLI